MKSDRLPREIEFALGAIRAATDGLLAAVNDGRGDDVRSALEERAAAIERLQAALRHDRSLSPAQLERMGDTARSIASQADEAKHALEASMERARKELRTFDRVAGAVRGYSKGSPETVLDRSR